MRPEIPFLEIYFYNFIVTAFSLPRTHEKANSISCAEIAEIFDPMPGVWGFWVD
jgi:hypothetical protein